MAARDLVNMTPRKHILALTIVAAALCTDHVLAVTSERTELRPRPQQMQTGQGWVRRLTGCLRRVFRALTLMNARCAEQAKVRRSWRPVDPMLPTVRLTFSQLRLPPPLLL